MRVGEWEIDLGRGMGPLELGAERRAVLDRLAEERVDVAADDDEPTEAEIAGGDIMLTFHPSAPFRLLQISVYDKGFQIEGRPVLGRRPHEIVERLGATEADTLWRADERHIDEPWEPDDEPPPPATNRDLFRHGTLWITSRGLGLVLSQGEVLVILLRRPADVPQKGQGPFTAEQRAFSELPNLPDLLVAPPAPGAQGLAMVQRLLTLACVAALGVLFWQGMQFQQRWNQAPVVEGEVIAVDPPPPATFPDRFTVAYQDRDGKPHQVVFRPADVYVLREVGEKVEVRYLPEAPDQPLGPARYRDAAFLVYAPYGIGIGVAYLVLQGIAWILARLIAPSMRPEPAASGDDEP